MFDRIVDKLHLSTEQSIDADPVKVVEVVQKRFGLSDGERSERAVTGTDMERWHPSFQFVSRLLGELQVALIV